MEGTISIVAVWGFLVAIIVVYVVFRLMTDRSRDGTVHPLYPFVSNSTDGMFPVDGEIKWAAYTVWIAGFAFFFGYLGAEVLAEESHTWLIHATGVCFLSGGVLWMLGAFGNRREK